MSIISFRCHTTIHLAPLVNQETIHQDMDRGQQLMSRINQGILREIKPKNPLVEWYYWKDKHTVSDVTEHSLFKMAQGMLSPMHYLILRSLPTGNYHFPRGRASPAPS